MRNAIPSVRFADIPSNQEYAEVLIRVQEAICAGNFDEAGRLCDEAVDLAEGLSVAEVHWMQDLSSDLEALCGEELLQKNPYSYQEYEALLAEKWNGIQNDPDGFLRLLRSEQSNLPHARMAYARGRAYGILGFLNVATVFTRMASNLDPQQPFYRMALITMLNDQQRFEELDKELTEILASAIATPDLIVNAAAISFNRAIKAPSAPERPYLGELRRKLQQIFSQNPVRVLKPGTAVVGLHTLGSIQDRLRRPAKAQQYFRQALEVDPQNQAVRISLALSLLQNDETEAARLFDQVAAEGTHFEIAYLFAAKYAGERGSFAHSTAMAEKALAVTGSTTLRAYAYEVLAINEAETNGPTRKAYEYFSEALRLAPQNTNIQANYNAFQVSLNENADQSEANKQPQSKHHSSQWVLWDDKLIEGVKFSHQASRDVARKNSLDWDKEMFLPVRSIYPSQSSATGFGS